MTLQFIDHALNLVLTGLLYGSEVWIISAFGLYVATHERSVTSPTAEATKTVGSVQVISSPTPLSTYLADPIEIVCEPVNWKQWKVGDLRKASIAKTCGVRTRPVGSRRNLSKGDLIAQYEQQLKRFTKAPTKKAIKRARIIA